MQSTKSEKRSGAPLKSLKELSAVITLNLGQMISGLLLFLIISSVACICSAAERPKLIVSGDHDNPPYEYMEDGRAAGFNIDLIKAVAEVLNYDVEIRLMPWNTARKSLETGKIDVLAGMYYLPERSQTFEFSVPHTMVSPGFFLRKGSAIKSISDLKGKEIIVQDMDAIHDLLQKREISSKIVAVEDPVDELKLLSSGRHDVVFMPSRLQGEYFINKLKLQGIESLNADIPQLKYCFAVKKGRKDLAAALDEGLNIIKMNGRYQAIYSKWFGVYEETRLWRTLKYFVAAIVVIGVLLLISLVWSGRLRLQIRYKSAEVKVARDTIIGQDERLRCLINGMPDFVIFKDAQSRWLEANDAAVNLFGLENIDYHGKNNLELAVINKAYKKTLLYCEETDKIAFSNEDLSKIEEEILGPDGVLRTYDVYKTPLYRPDGSPKALIIMGRDITERKQMYEELKKAHAEMELKVEERTAELHIANEKIIASTSMLENIIENFPGVVFWKDRSSVYLGCNWNFAAAAGLSSPDEIVGKNDYDMPWASTEAYAYREADQRVMESGIAKLNIIESQLQADGQVVWFDTTKVPLFNDAGRVIGILGASSDITERKKAADALRESEEKYRNLVENIDLGVFISTLTTPGRFVQVNRAMVNMCGFNSAEEMLNSTVDEWYDNPEDRAQLIKDLIQHGYIRSREINVHRRDGSRAWASVTITLQRDHSGIPLHINGVLEDITLRKEAELAQLESEERYRAVVEGFDGMIYICSSDFRIEFMNSQMIKRTGYDATGEYCFKALHNLESICPWCVSEKVLNGETVKWEVKSPKDSRWYYIINTPLRRSDGKISKQAMIVDITESKKAQEALAESEQRYKLLLDNLNTGVFKTTLDMPGRFLLVNQAMVTAGGWDSEEELLNQPVMSTYYDPAEREAVLSRLKKDGYIKNYEVRIRRKDNSFVWSTLTLALQLDNTTGEKYISGMVEDISYRKETELALLASEERYRAVVDSFEGYIYICDKDYKIEFMNRSLINQCGRDGTGDKCHTVLYNLETPCPWCVKWRVLAGETVRWEVRNPRDSRWLYMINTPLYHPDGSISKQTIMIDITDRKTIEEELRRYRDRLENLVKERTDKLLIANVKLNESQKKLRELYAHMQEAREEERARIAREIHDEMGQVLTALKIDLVWLKDRLANSSPELFSKAETDIELVNSTIRTVKSICTELRPGILDMLGLAAAIEWQASEFEKRTGIKCMVDIDQHEVEIDDSRRTALFRIFQEALTNIARHSRATEASALLLIVPGSVTLEVRDNGIGIDEKQMSKAGSFGLMGMRERVYPFEGVVTINSKPGNGTIVNVTMPLPD